MDTKAIRKEAFLTQREFAEKLKVSIRTVQSWEQGRSEPSIKTKRKIITFCKRRKIDYLSKGV